MEDRLKFRYKTTFVFIFLTCISVSLASAAFAKSNDDYFDYPLKAIEVVRKFEEPATPYSAGHRGVAFRAKPGTPVFAAGDGQVIFAGLVADGLHVTIAHGKDFKSTYTFLATKKVKVGDQVFKGDLIGSTSNRSIDNQNSSFLFTMRFKNSYVDPFKYLRSQVRIREIRLGELSDGNESLLKKLVAFERKQMKSLFISGSYFYTREQTFLEWLKEKGSEVIENGGKEILVAYEDSKERIKALRETAKQILQDHAAGLSSKVKKGIRDLAKLERAAIRKLKKVISIANKYGQIYLSLYQDALSEGLDVAKVFLEKTSTFPILLSRLHNDLLLGIYDWSTTSVNTTQKVLDQYFDVDWPMLLREMLLPVSCISGGCTTPVKLACDPKAKFKVRKPSQGYKGSGNGVMFVPGLNSKGPVSVLPEDKGDGTKVGQSVNFPWKTLGYLRNEVSFYSYKGVGSDTESNAPFQNLHISAALMDKQIKQWKRDNPKRKLDLIGHSLGGSVTALWLAEYYDDTDASYPKLGKIIMYAPPLTGTAAATSGQIIDSRREGLALHDDLNDLLGDGIVPTSDSDSLEQVAEDGELEATLRKSQSFKKVDVQVIRSASDWVVPAGSQPIEGVTEIIIDTDSAHKNKTANAISPFLANGAASFTAHSDLTTDESATAIAQRILESKKVPCVSVSNSLRGIFKSATVHATEVTLARGTRDLADFTDYKADDENVATYLNSYAG